jgi:hypothetical protein
VVEGARLESVYRGNSIEGSNPSLSAKGCGLVTHHFCDHPRLQETECSFIRPRLAILSA